MRTLGRSMVLDAVFLVGIAIAGNAAPACRPGAGTAGATTNRASGSGLHDSCKSDG
jgi:hypothetical protein